MPAPRPASPPRAAIRLLMSRLPIDQRDAILGDLTELFADRVETGRPFNRLWFWAQAAGFVLGFATAATYRLPAAAPPGRFSMLIPGRLASSVRHAFRRLAFEWRYALGVVLILAVGIGPAAAMLSIIRTVLLRPLAYAEPERLGLVRLELGQIHNHPGLSLSEIQDFRKLTDLFDGVEGEARVNEVSFGPPDQLEPLASVAISPGMLPMLGVTPIAGRQFTEEDAAARATPPVMLDYGLWQSHFGGDRGVVGRTVPINGAFNQVVGILPAGFVLTTGRAVPKPIDVYFPLQVRDFRNFWAYPTIVRLKPGVTFARANTALETLAATLVKEHPKEYSDARLQFVIQPLLDDMVRDTRPALRAAMGGVLLLMLIAVANATALVVARLKTRERDLAIRSAIGASQGSLVLDVLVESVVLSVYGAAAGVGLAAAAVAAARRLVPHTVPRYDQISIGWELLVYCGLLALAGLVVSGLIPVWRVSRSTPWRTLRAGSIQGGRADGALARLLLVGAQIALTVVLAFGAVQLVRSASRLREVQIGFDANVLTFRVPIDFRRYNKPELGAGVYHRVRDRLRQIPGVEAAGAISHLPLSGSVLTDAYTSDLTKEAGWDLAVANYYAVTPGYFETLRIPFLQGRDFTDVEDASGAHLVVVDASLARAEFPGVSNVIGRTLRLGYGLPDSQIVGVVGSVRGIEVGRDVRPQVYAPFGAFTFPMNFAIRAKTDPARLVDAVRSAVQEIGPGRALAGFAMLSDNVAGATSTLRAVTDLVTVLAISAGLLSAVGLYTVIAFVVDQRKRATAIRTALGAAPGQIMWHHLRTSGLVTLVALPAGALLAFGAAPLFGSLVYGVSERDVWSLALATLVAATVGVLGTFVPVRRAALADPVTVLRGE